MMGAVIASVDLADIVFRFREQFFVPVDNPYCGEQLVSVHTFIIHVYRSAVIVEAINRIDVAVNDVERVVDSRRHKGRSLVCVAYIHGITASIAVILGDRSNFVVIRVSVAILLARRHFEHISHIVAGIVSVRIRSITRGDRIDIRGSAYYRRSMTVYVCGCCEPGPVVRKSKNGISSVFDPYEFVVV